MKHTLTGKIIKKHLVSGDLKPGTELAIKIDQTLTQDATGTMAYLEFLNFNLPKIATKLSVSYVDHNTLQAGFENADFKKEDAGVSNERRREVNTTTHSAAVRTYWAVSGVGEIEPFE